MGEEGAKPRSKQGRRSVRLTVLFMVLIPLVAVGGAYYYARSQSYQSTDDAFIDGHIINVAPQVAGRVDRVLVTDNQVVKKGDLVVVLDDRNFTATSNQKAAALDNVRAQEGAAKASIEQALAHVNSLQATVESDQAAADASRAQAEKAAKDFQRTMELFRNRVVSAQDQDAARATQKAVEPGDYVQTGQILFALVPDSVWVTANYKEDQIGLSICIFTLASALCGLANSLGMLILARIVQGAGGGALQPISQAVLLETFPPEKRGSAMSIYIMGVVVAPILGPTLGGWMTDNMS